MGNAFMPSVASSLNDAGQRSLLDVMQQRLLQAEMQKLLFAQQRQQGMDAFNVGMKLRDQGQQDETLRLRRGEAAHTRRVDEDKAAEAQWERDSREAALISAANMPASASPMDRRILAQEAGAPMSAFDLPEPKETPAERSARIVADEESRAQGKAAALKRFPELKPTKAAKGPRATKEDTQLPTGFRSAIRARVGSAGFEDVDAALASIRAKWAKWRQDYPQLDASKVKSELENIYGPRESSGARLTLSTPDDLARRKANVTAKINGLQNY